MRKQQKVKAWVGFLDGKPHFYRHYPERTNPLLVADLFRSKRAAKKEYEDVRRVTLLIEGQQP